MKVPRLLNDLIIKKKLKFPCYSLQVCTGTPCVKLPVCATAFKFVHWHTLCQVASVCSDQQLDPNVVAGAVAGFTTHPFKKGRKPIGFSLNFSSCLLQVLQRPATGRTQAGRSVSPPGPLSNLKVATGSLGDCTGSAGKLSRGPGARATCHPFVSGIMIAHWHGSWSPLRHR